MNFSHLNFCNKFEQHFYDNDDVKRNEHISSRSRHVLPHGLNTKLTCLSSVYLSFNPHS